jgi:1-phosphofructokinase family hexose kinase
MIWTVTLNPAMDKILFINSFERNITSRIIKTVDTLGGKGVHISYNLNLMNIDNIATGIIFGTTGKKIESILKKRGIKTLFLKGGKKRGDSRINIVIREDDGSSTIIAEQGVKLKKEEIQDFKDMLKIKIKKEDKLIISGDASNAPSAINNEIINYLKDKNLKIIIDGSGETLRKSIKIEPFLIKPNKDELESLLGFEIKTDEDVIKGIKILEKKGVKNIIVSLGKHGSIGLIKGELLRAVVPKINVENTVGCGDCFLSGIIYGLEKKLTAKESLRYASAISTAAATEIFSVGFNKKKAMSLMGKIKIKEL